MAPPDDGHRRHVSPDLLPQTLKAAGSKWWIEAEQTWSWILWRNDRDDFALDVVCGSVGIWEEFIELTDAELRELRDSCAIDDHAALTKTAARLAAGHQCGEGTAH